MDLKRRLQNDGQCVSASRCWGVDRFQVVLPPSRNRQAPFRLPTTQTNTITIWIAHIISRSRRERLVNPKCSGPWFNMKIQHRKPNVYIRSSYLHNRNFYTGNMASLYCSIPWWRHQMETFSALLAISAGNSPVPGEFPTQRPVTRSFDVYFDLRPNNGWVNNREAGDLRRHRAHYDVIVMLWRLMRVQNLKFRCRTVHNTTFD